jgi:hypothetical protein
MQGVKWKLNVEMLNFVIIEKMLNLRSKRFSFEVLFIFKCLLNNVNRE